MFTTMPTRVQLLSAMKQVFGDDRRRIDHALSVLDHAEALLVDHAADRDTVVAAAILHDIGIHEAERKHGSFAGKWQELEGPPIARRILSELGAAAAFAEAVCAIVGNHHSARGELTPEFDVVWDADWLVNLPEECGDDREKLAAMAVKVFRTAAGRQRAADWFGLR
ncbi:MAG: phosphohydrolase [Armatimonadetes bacterium CG_4_10_14_0_8_um_filter_66_14]|nr:MAG: phosphohydrolase [Armatimonadetes bacterium CG06_land_8_20_14_3_00_66_21]PIZ32464.1 MAG: phosphohydrolase [Armatimonadetes bacterium CG_4_10_14_0_8_um_filter_66_14]PJB71738.1 MAG: phosphohydrolase [Armatimonadetes bacterium CG_4_9_14_3_um_filter_66_14]